MIMPSDRDDKEFAAQEITSPVREEQNPTQEIAFPVDEKQNVVQEIAFPVSLQKRTNPQRCTVNGVWRMPQITILGTRGNVESAAPRYSRHSGVLVDNSNIRMR